MVKEIIIGGTTYTFKDTLLGLDLIATFEEGSNEKKTLIAAAGLIARASQKPKLSQKDVVMLPYAEFVKMIKEFSALYGTPGEFDFLENK